MYHLLDQIRSAIRISYYRGNIRERRYGLLIKTHMLLTNRLEDKSYSKQRLIGQLISLRRYARTVCEPPVYYIIH